MVITTAKRFDLAEKGLKVLKRVSDVALRSGYSQKEIAYIVGKSEAWTSQALGYGGQSKFTLDMVPALKVLFGLEILKILATESDCFLSENPNGQRVNGKNFADLLREFARLTESTGEAFRDGEVTAAEAAEIRVAWENVKSVGEGFVRAVEGEQR